MANVSQQRGMALTQVLLITALISIFIVSITFSVKGYLETATQVKYRTEAKLKIKTVESLLLEALLTQSWVDSGDTPTNEIARHWNFYGDWFQVEGVSVRITNVSSLMRLSVIDESYYKRYLEAMGIESEKAETISQGLVNYQVGDNRHLIQSLHELSFVEGVNDKLATVIARYSTPIVVNSISPMFAPDELLTAEMDEDQAKRVIALRKQGSFNRNNFELATGIEPDIMITSYPGPIFRIEFAYRENDIRQSQQITVELRPYSKRPLVLLGSGTLSEETETELRASNNDNT